MPNLLVDDAAIEHRLLELAYTSMVKLTAPMLAFYAPCSIADAERVLEHLAASDRLRMEVEDDGTVVYHVPARERVEPPAQPPALVRAVPRTLTMQPTHQLSPTLAAVLGGLVPGAGHLYAGRIVAGVLWFCAVTLGYVLFLPGLILHIASMMSAALTARRASITGRVTGQITG